MPFPEGITTRQDGLGEQFPFLVGEVATEEGQHLDPAYLSDLQSGFIYYDAFLLSFTVTQPEPEPEPEPEPDEPCCPPLEEPEPECAPTVERPYTNSPCHAPDCMQAWEDGPTLWDGGGTWWDCEEDCDPTIEVLGFESLGMLHPSIPVDVVDPLSDETTTSVMAIFTTAEAAHYGDFTVPDGWTNPVNPSNPYDGIMVDAGGDAYLLVWTRQGVIPPDQITSNYHDAFAVFTVLTTRMRPDQFIAGLVSGVLVTNQAGDVASIAQAAPASGQLVVMALSQLGGAG